MSLATFIAIRPAAISSAGTTKPNILISFEYAANGAVTATCRGMTGVGTTIRLAIDDMCAQAGASRMGLK